MAELDHARARSSARGGPSGEPRARSRRRGRGLLIGLLAGLLSGSIAASSAAAAGAPEARLVDAALLGASPASPPASPGPAADPPREAAREDPADRADEPRPDIAQEAALHERRDHLLHELTALRKLLTLTLPEDSHLRDLFDLDLTDEAAVGARKGQLQALIDARKGAMARQQPSSELPPAPREPAQIDGSGGLEAHEGTGGSELHEGSRATTGEASASGADSRGSGGAAAESGADSRGSSDSAAEPGADSRGPGDAPTGDRANPRAPGDAPPGDRANPSAPGDAPTGDRANPSAPGDAPPGDRANPREPGDAPPGDRANPRAPDAPASSNPAAPPADGGIPSPPPTGAPAKERAAPVLPSAIEALHQEIADLELKILETRLEILSRPLPDRQLLVDAEEDRLRFEQARALAEEASRNATEEARLAEAARQRALEAAVAARTALQRTLAEERAAAEEARRDQAQLRGRLAEARHRYEKERQEGEWPGQSLALQVAGVAAGSDEANDLYDQIVAALEDLRAQLRLALAEAEADPRVPRYHPRLPDIPPDAGAAITAEALALRKTAIDLDAAADDLAQTASTLALDVLDTTFERESQLYFARIALLDKLPAARRAAVLGLGREGIAQLRREFDRLILAARWYRIQRQSAPKRLFASLRDLYTFYEVATSLLWILLILVVALYVVRRGPTWIRGLRSFIVRNASNTGLIRTLQGLLGVIDALFRPLVLFAAVTALWPALDGAQQIGEVAVLYKILVYFATYRLILRAAHTGIARLMHARIEEATSVKVLRSLQLIGRTVLVIVIFQTISERILGRGYLFLLVAGFAWICALPIAIILIRWWRESIADAYLVFRDHGSLADAVRSSRRRWYGFFVATAAVAILAVALVGRFIRRFVLGFEQSRKALAFMFRRRLERRAEDIGAINRAPLPEDLATCLTAAPVTESALRLAGFTGQRQLDEHIDEWRSSPVLGAALLVGDPGVGKTTWLLAAVERAAAAGLPTSLLRLRERTLSREGMLAAIVRELDPPPEARRSLASLRDWLRRGPKRMIAVDNLHCFTLRGVDTSQAWEAFDDLIQATGHQVFWLCTMARQPFEFVSWSRRGAGPFRELIELPPWSEEEIAVLLRRRTDAAGYTVVYDDLIVDRVEGVEAHAQLVSTEREYARLIWDYADGIPAVALECWRSSLCPEGDRRVRVRLFRRPPESLLEGLDERQRFLLGAVIWHNNLSAPEAALSLRYRMDVCVEGLALLGEWGALTAEDGRYRPSIPWLPAIHRYLRRHHLIEV
ncbi:MAG: hypothetical protein R3B09_00680 [Nannocystaceae bacterium]